MRDLNFSPETYSRCVISLFKKSSLWKEKVISYWLAMKTMHCF